MRGGQHAYGEYLRLKKEIGDPPISSLMMLVIRKADTVNTAKIRAMWPELYEEFLERYNAPGGVLPGESWPNVP